MNQLESILNNQTALAAAAQKHHLQNELGELHVDRKTSI